jgi:hypothetical protein
LRLIQNHQCDERQAHESVGNNYEKREIIHLQRIPYSTAALPRLRFAVSYHTGPSLNCEAAGLIRVFDTQLGLLFG